MPRKFRLNVDDPVVQYALTRGTNKKVVSDAQLRAEIIAEGIVRECDLSIDDFNSMFGPKTLAPQYEIASVGLLRRQYRIKEQLRCLYGILTEKERDEGLTTACFNFPAANNEHEVWGTGTANAPSPSASLAAAPATTAEIGAVEAKEVPEPG